MIACKCIDEIKFFFFCRSNNYGRDGDLGIFKRRGVTERIARSYCLIVVKR